MKDEKGFTLVELIVVFGLLGIVLSVIFSPVTFSFKNFGMQKEQSNMVSSARKIMDFITREIRQSDNVEKFPDYYLIDGSAYKFVPEEKALYKGKIENDEFTKERKIIEGISHFSIEIEENKVEIKIVIEDKKGEEHELSSFIYIR